MNTHKAHIVVVDDDNEMRELVQDYLSKEGYFVKAFPSAAAALSFFEQNQEAQQTDLVITDLRMPHIDGIEFTERLRAKKFTMPLILITAFGSIETAIEAIRKGAFDYITKPFKLAQLLVNVERAVRFHRLQNENEVLREEVKKEWSLGDLVGKSPGMRTVYEMVQKLSHASANVLIMGESGTGKEMVARAIHRSGPRAQGPFVAINCTAIPDTLLESELFGHAKGSFTGAAQRKKGLFEEANGGTLFLDEIGDMDVSLQAKLLRVLQEKRIRAVGDNEFRDIDVRVIAATHKNLKQAIHSGQFREDLYYRLAVIPIVIPPLRHRPEDIPLLAEYFLKKYCSANGVPNKKFHPEAMQKLTRMKWEGNVRELENVVERVVVLTPNTLIQAKDIPTAEQADGETFYGNFVQELPTLQDLEKRYITFVLEKTGNKKEKASQILGINRRTLYRKEREYGFVMNAHEEEPLYEEVVNDLGSTSSAEVLTKEPTATAL